MLSSISTDLDYTDLLYLYLEPISPTPYLMHFYGFDNIAYVHEF